MNHVLRSSRRGLNGQFDDEVFKPVDRSRRLHLERNRHTRRPFDKYFQFFTRMETKLGCIEASYLLWDNLWKKGAANDAELNILDVVQLSADGAIIGWLFTSSTGVVKSKLTSNWRLDAILDRCSYFKDDSLAQHYNGNARKWAQIRHADQLAQAIASKGPTRSAIIAHPLLTKATTFMVVECAKEQKMNRIEIPSYHNTWLCGVGVRGGHASTHYMPTDTIPSKDKESNNISREFINTVIKLLESNLRVKVTSIAAVVVFETVGVVPGLSAEGRVVRLHHLQHVTYRPVAATLSAGAANDAFSEVNSSIADQSLGGSALLPAKPSRVDCCHGDFCQFISGEASEGTFPGAAGDLDDDFGEGTFSVQSEARKAVQRHRPAKKNDSFHSQRGGGEQEDEEGGDSTADKMDLFPGQTDHLIAAAQQSLKASMAQSVPNLFGDSPAMGSGESMRSKQQGSLGTVGSLSALQTLKSKLLGEQVKRTEKKLKVMAKSIALARQEMAEIEQSDLDALNGAGREDSPNTKSLKASLRRRGATPAAPSSPTSGGGVSGGGNATKVWPASLTKWWLSVGRNLPKNSLSVMVPSSSAHCISQTVLSTKSATAPSSTTAASSKPRSRWTGDAPAEIREEDEVEQANSMYFGWYYNPVRVCERCHKIYTELDRQRKLRFKHLMRKQRELLDKADDESQRWREVEQRIFKQRQFVSRLAKLETASSAHNRAHRSLSRDDVGLTGAHSLAFDSVAEGPGFSAGVAFGRAYKHNADYGVQGSSAAGSAPIPSRALPPMPWNLSSEGRSEAYARGTDSILTRRILEKAPEMSLNGSYAEEVSQQWAHLTAPSNAQRQQQPRRAQKLAKLPARPAKAFDPERLLHPWQRQMNAMKKKLLGEEDGDGGYVEEGEEKLEAEELQPPAQRGAPQKRLQPLSASSSAPAFQSGTKATGSISRSQTDPTPPSDGPKTGLRHLQTISSTWGDGDPQEAPSPSKSFKSALASPTDGSVRNSAAVERVGNALAEGLTRPAPSVEQQGKPPAHPRSTPAVTGQGSVSGGEESESDDDEEIGWSPFAVR